MRQPERTGGEAVVEQLLVEGVDVVFGIPGIHVMTVLDGLYANADDVRFITTRHEQATAFMADGYARVTGKPGTSLVVPGPGVYNAGTGLATAYAASSPVLQIAGQINSSGIGAGNHLPHEVHDQLDLVRPITKRAERVASVDEIPKAIHGAFDAMQSGRPRPTHVEIPADLLAAPTAAPLLPASQPERAAADADLIANAAALLASASNPILIAGGGVHIADAAAVFGQLADHLQAGVITSREGKGAVDEHSPLSLGTIFVQRRLNAALQAADVVLAVGTRLQGFDLGEQTRLIHIDADPSEIGRFRPTEIAIAADARLGVGQLLDAVRSISDAATSRASELRSIRASVDRQLDAIEPQSGIVRALASAVPDDAVLAVDATMIGYMCHMRFPVRRPRSWLTSSYMGTLGFAMNMALGAKIGAPERPVISISGDGGFLFGSNELATAAQYDIATINIVFNDAAYGNTLLDQREQFDARYIGTELRNPDLVRYAESFGVAARRVESPAQLAGAIGDALTDTRATVIEMPIPRLNSAF